MDAVDLCHEPSIFGHLPPCSKAHPQDPWVHDVDRDSDLYPWGRIPEIDGPRRLQGRVATLGDLRLQRASLNTELTEAVNDLTRSLRRLLEGLQ